MDERGQETVYLGDAPSPASMPIISSARLDPSLSVKEIVLSIDDRKGPGEKRSVGGSYFVINRLLADQKRRTRMTDEPQTWRDTKQYSNSSMPKSRS